MAENNSILQSVERTIKILNLFSEQQKSLTLTEISKLLGTPLPLTTKYLNTLTSFRLLKKDENTKRYSLGFELIKYGNLAKQSNSVKEIAHPEIVKLANDTGETIYLIVPDLPFYQGVCISIIESTHTVTSKFRMTVPLYAGASKKAILAHLGEEYFQSMLSNIQMVPLAKNTPLDPQKLLRELEAIRNKGYAISSEETMADSIGIAAPIFDHSGIVGSLGIYGPMYRFPEDRIPLLVEKIKEATYNISISLGYTKD